VGAAVAGILPLALGIAAFPIPVITVILLLFTPRARQNGIAFLSGWLLGIFTLTFAFVLLADDANRASSEPHTVVSAIKLLLGVGLLVLSLRKWLSRPAADEEPVVPAWMNAIGGFGPFKAARTSLLLTVGNPKNLGLGGAAAATISDVGLGRSQEIASVLVFTVLASVTVAAPVLCYLIVGEKAVALMKRIEAWLLRKNAAVMAVILLVIGSILVLQGTAALLRTA
jgi:hypothetical protein